MTADSWQKCIHWKYTVRGVELEKAANVELSFVVQSKTMTDIILVTDVHLPQQNECFVKHSKGILVN